MKILRTAGKVLAALVLAAALIVCCAVLFLFFWPSVGKMPGAGERSEYTQRASYYYDGSFHNPNDTDTLTGEGWPPSDRRITKEVIPAVSPDFPADPSEDSLSYTWFGHSSFLLQMGSVSILVDPVFSTRCSPVGFMGPKRFSELPVSIDELPHIDAVFISHDHYDHLDYRTVLGLKDRADRFIVPLGVDVILRGWGVAEEKIITLGWWESTVLSGVEFTLVPSRHFTGRNPLKRNAVLWGGLYMNNGLHRVYYTGDGGYCGVFAQVREALGEPEVMIAECGQYDPAWRMIHMFPEETVLASVDAGAGWLIPVHWGTFCICNHAWDDPIIRVCAASEDSGVSIATPMIGQTVDYKELSSFCEHWWEDCESTTPSYGLSLRGGSL
ncbi:MAG: MBL fold metallo-hydrolase [Eubacteriaceae bacterium]|nr:MBL fold metallo-hydrolase [Eubacteriaceae bacterium]